MNRTYLFADCLTWNILLQSLTDKVDHLLIAHGVPNSITGEKHKLILTHVNLVCANVWQCGDHLLNVTQRLVLLVQMVANGTRKVEACKIKRLKSKFVKK